VLDHEGLAGARARDDKERALAVFDRFDLEGVGPAFGGAFTRVGATRFLGGATAAAEEP